MYEELLESCRLCPRECGVNRNKGERGYCGAGKNARVALVSLHKWEEPCIAGENGAGTVFFSFCPLRCVYCQNSEISDGGKGEEITTERLAQIFAEEEERGAEVLDLVSPTHFTPQIISALGEAKKKGLKIPVVWNTSGYEKTQTIELVAPFVDVFLPDLKYFSEEKANAYSSAPDYFAVASKAIERMVELKGEPQFSKSGIMTRGVLVRHLVLPSLRAESKKIVAHLWESFGDKIYLSLLRQYTPLHRASEFKELKRKLTTFEYESVTDFAAEIGFTRCFVQEKESASSKYVPVFNGDGVKK